ncbi:alpha/beta hydrolase [Massilia sp.]|uniref:alpha/beta hydrolase n=1 Tax=Massilia sp. TaxID=1882437 RepID=UPI00352FB8F9
MHEYLIYAAVLLFLVVGAGLVVARSSATVDRQDHVGLTATGRLKVASLALIVEVLTPLVNRLVRYPKVHAGSVTRFVVKTSYGDTRIDVYRPVQSGDSPLPVHFNVHGGGFVVGNLKTDAPWCNYLCDRAQCVVINIDYALAPRHTFPDPVYQCHEVISWAKVNAGDLGIDIERMSIGGDSAGGNLSLAVALLAIEKPDFVLRAVVPGVPLFDIDSDPATKNVIPGFKQDLTVKDVELARDVYVPRYTDRKHPLASPLFSDRLAELPSVFIVSAKNDILHSDAVAMETKLQAHGVDVGHLDVEGAGHGLLHLGNIELMLMAWDAMVAAIVRASQVGKKIQTTNSIGHAATFD